MQDPIDVFTSADADALGLTRHQVRQRVRSGAWTRVGKGRYATTESADVPGSDLYQRERALHGARAVAAADRNPGCTIAFESAAALLGMALWDPLPRHVNLIVPERGWTGRRAQTSFRMGTLADHHVIQIGAPCTNPSRTWVDLARTSSLRQSLVAGDHGLRLGLFTVSSLRETLRESGRARGFRRAENALGLLDARRESPLESASSAYFVDHRLPLPVPQREFYDGAGRLVARVDFWWEASRLIGECDGRMKYRTADDLYLEKRREDRLREMGLAMVRWGTQDLRSDALARRLRSRLTD